MTLDHIGFAVADFAKSQDFYTSLAPLGIVIVMGGDGYAGIGQDGRAQFSFNAGQPASGGTHIAFAADDRAQVRAFHAAALAAGGKDNGGARPATAISPQLLRRLRHRLERAQRRGRLPQAGGLTGYSAATAGRACKRCSARSTHCAVSFSCTPFCDSRSCRRGNRRGRAAGPD